MAPHNDLDAFHTVLRSSRRIVALCGAGLSASSGLPTFRGAGGYWRHHDATRLATMQAFRTDPGLVWLFYGYRRHMALKADPNPAHRALAALAKDNPDFLCLTQNVDSEFSKTTLCMSANSQATFSVFQPKPALCSGHRFLSHPAAR